MTSIISIEGRTPPQPPPALARRSTRPAFIALVTAAVLLGTIVMMTVSQIRASRDLARLSPALRQEVFARSLGERRTVCLQPAAASGTLRAHCLDVARFVEQFPDCRADCAAMVSRVMPPPARK